MPRITRIQQQQIRQDRYSIYVDDKYAFPLSANSLLSSGLFAGQEMDETELENIKIESEAAKAYDQALNYISLRRRSQREIEDYLRRKEYEVETINRTVARLVASKFIDDLEFASAWVRDRQLMKPSSKRRLEQELFQKGVTREIVDAALEELDDAMESGAIKEIIKKKLTQSRYRDQHKLVRYLTSLGFSYYLVKKALADEG